MQKLRKRSDTMNTRNIIIGVVLAFVLLFSMNTASALGICGIDFGEVKAGETATREVYAYQASSEGDNFFVYEILESPELEQWITVEPESWWMGPSYARIKPVATLTVPADAPAGEYNGWIKIAGSKVFGGGTIGFTVATKSRIHVTVPENANPIPEPTPVPTPDPTPDPALAVEVVLEPDEEPFSVKIDKFFEDIRVYLAGLFS